MENFIKIKETSLKVPLLPESTELILNSLVDSNNNPVTMGDLGQWFVLMLRQDQNFEIIQCDGIVQNTDNVIVTILNRNLNPKFPYNSYPGKSWSAGTQVIHGDDPKTMSILLNTLSPNNNFNFLPTSNQTMPTAPNELATKAYVDSIITGQTDLSLNSLKISVLVDPALATGVVKDQLVYVQNSGYVAILDNTNMNTLYGTTVGFTIGITNGPAAAGEPVTITVWGIHTLTAPFSMGTVYAGANGSRISTVGTGYTRAIGRQLTTTKLLFDPYSYGTIGVWL
jgi:hypothetical protein